ncbi:MAG: flagellar biosynthesis protein FlhB [Phycisphaerales bacterium]|nr:flagellar biosynthesis protein FlhB [Phycisphaerales bacterium]
MGAERGARDSLKGRVVAEDMGERTEQPTGRRLDDARSRGQVAKSQDLSAALELSAALVLIVSIGGFLVSTLSGLMRRVLDARPSGGLLDVADIEDLARTAAIEGAKALGPILLIAGLVAYLAQAIQVGWHFSTRPLEPKLDRLNFIAGLGKVFSRRNLVKTIVNSVKLSIVLLVAWLWIRATLARVVTLPELSMLPALFLCGKLAVELAIWLLAIMLLLGVADWAYQRWQHLQDLRMTKQEVKDERRSMEGDPEIKGRRFRMARDIALQRLNQAVPTADVIVTNPTHFSVAIKYDADTMNAPKVVAKGVDFMAMRIRQIASLEGVPMVERPPLARALYYGVDVGREIPQEHFQAVAEILAYVYRLNERNKAAAV